MLLLCWHNCEHLTLQSNVDDTYAFDLRPLPCLRLQPPWNMLCGSTDCMGPHMFTPGSSESLISFYILRGQVKIPLIREFWKVIRWSMCAGSQTQSSYNKFWHRVLKGIVTELIDVHVYHSCCSMWITLEGQFLWQNARVPICIHPGFQSSCFTTEGANKTHLWYLFTWGLRPVWLGWQGRPLQANICYAI